MKFNDQIIEILSNFSSINQSIVFNPGDIIETMSPMKSIIAKAKVDVEFEKTFGIYDLPTLLSTISSYKDPDLTLEESRIRIQSGSKKTHQSFSSVDLIITPPQKDIVLPSADVELNLSADDLKFAVKQAALISATDMAITGRDGKLFIEALSLKNSGAGNYEDELGETDKNFRMIFLIENIQKLLPRDYEVQISSKGLSKFVAKDITYWVAVEQTSKFEG